MTRHWLNFVLEQPSVHPAGYLGTVRVEWDGSLWEFHLDDLGVLSSGRTGQFRLTLAGSTSEGDSFAYEMPEGAGVTRERVLAYAQDRANAHIFGDEK